MLGNYTYSQMNNCKKFYCSKRQSIVCKARVTLDDGGAIAEADVHHTHPPDEFFITKSGEYIRLNK
ncbi:hypothetical protein JYU34_004372 [Plutella xylostella]|uniref:FLYWCH-type domain-containing protein n=1 Tax=Plutella xylostella TaxID=51655 RepID=A0ABQ7QXT9_PLUXY|nr:hypothetical protein JYU34_004372 [Plutella xylostella]